MDDTSTTVRQLMDQGIRLVALSWVDGAGISRVKAVPAHRLAHSARWGVGMAPVFETYLVDDTRVVDEVHGGVFVEYPHVRPYFYDGRTLAADDPNRHRVEAVTELMLDVFEWIWHRREGISEVDRQAWAEYVGAMFALSPVLRDYHLAHLARHPTITDLYFSQGEFEGTRFPGQRQAPEGA